MTGSDPSLENTLDDPLAMASYDELAACAHLLALSVAHHRAKFGIVPIATTRAEVGADLSGKTNGRIAASGRSTLLEALDLARAARSRDEQAELADLAAHLGDERRSQMRISVRTAVKLSALDGEAVFDASLHNISWGGAAVRCDGITAAVGTRLCLLLPARRNQTIRIETTVLRKYVLDGTSEYGLRFDSLDPDDEDRLMEVLKLLLATPGVEQRRSEARLVQRLEVEYGDAGEFYATLEDISASGLMITVPEPLEIGQSLLVSLSSIDTPFGLNLRGRVVHQALVEDNDIDLYRVGLQFEHPSPRLRERISAVISELALLRPRSLLAEGGVDCDPPAGARGFR